MSLIGAGAAHAATLNVPSQHRTIKAAVEAAGNSAAADTVRIAPGTYRERVEVLGDEGLTIVGTGGASQTKIVAPGGGSAIDVRSGRVTIDGVAITGGEGTEFGQRLGGGVFVFARKTGPANVTLQNCLIADNEALGASGKGGGVYVGRGTKVKVQNCNVANNRAGNAGGGLYVDEGASLEVIGGAIEGNRSSLRSENGAGGGIAAGNADVTVRGTSITRNQSSFAGGGIQMINSPSRAQRTLKLTDCDISSNITTGGRNAGRSADDQGGAIHIEDRVLLDMDRCLLRGNRADSGGAISNFRAVMQVNDSLLEANRAVGDSKAASGGGGIISIGNSDGACPSVALVDSAVVRNVTGWRGGGIVSAPSPGCGGGVATLLVTRSIVSHNVANSDLGGGIQAATTRLTLIDSHLNSNEVRGSGGLGGALVLTEAATEATIDRTTIAANIASVRAGAVLLQDATMDVAGSFVYGNQAAGGLGGLWVRGPAAGTVQGNVIADNSDWQIAETDRAVSRLDYAGNHIRGGAGVYFGQPSPNVQAKTIDQFQNALGPRATQNDNQVGAFQSFLARPRAFVAFAPGRTYLSYTATPRATVEIPGELAPTPDLTAALAAAGGACEAPKSYELQVTRGNVTTPAASGPIAGAQCQPPAPELPEPNGGGPGPGKATHKRKLSIRYRDARKPRRRAFKGRVRSDKRKCVKRVRVKVFKKRRGKDKRVGADRTNRRGRYKVRERRVRGRYYAKVNRDAKSKFVCAGARSKAKRFR